MRRVLKVLGVVLAVLVVLAGAALAAVQPLARWETRRLLGSLKGMQGSFESCQVRIRDLSYELRGVKLDKVGPDGRHHPFVTLPEMTAGLYGRELLRGHLVASVDLTRPRVILAAANEPAAKRSPQEVGGVAQRFQGMFPLLIDRIQVKDGELRWVEEREPEKPVLRLQKVAATLENFATRPALARGEPTVLAGRGTLQGSGQVQVFASADPLAKSLTFAGQASVRDLVLRDVANLVESKSEVSPTKGTIDLYASFQSRDGRLTGGVRPLLHGVEVRAGKGGLGPKIKEWLADAGLQNLQGPEARQGRDHHPDRGDGERPPDAGGPDHPGHLAERVRPRPAGRDGRPATPQGAEEGRHPRASPPRAHAEPRGAAGPALGEGEAMTSGRAALLVAACLAACGGARKESRAASGQAGQRQGRAEGSHAARPEGGRRQARSPPRSGVEQGTRSAQREEASGGTPPRVASSPEALLGPEQVSKLQQALASKKLLHEHRQGQLDAPTSAAIRRFQEQQGLAATGLPDKETLRELGVSAEEALGKKQGDRGPSSTRPRATARPRW